MRITLIVVGGALDLAGIFLVALPELTGPWHRLRTATARMARWARSRVFTLLRIRPAGTTYVDSGTATATFSGRASLVSGLGPAADLDRKLSFLLEQAQRTQERLNELERRVEDLPAGWRDELRRGLDELERRLERAIRASREMHVYERLAGIGCLAVGSVLLSIANLI